MWNSNQIDSVLVTEIHPSWNFDSRLGSSFNDAAFHHELSSRLLWARAGPRNQSERASTQWNHLRILRMGCRVAWRGTGIGCQWPWRDEFCECGHVWQQIGGRGRAVFRLVQVLRFRKDWGRGHRDPAWHHSSGVLAQRRKFVAEEPRAPSLNMFETILCSANLRKIEQALIKHTSSQEIITIASQSDPFIGSPA